MKEKDNPSEIITAKVSAASAEGWRNFCAANGISVTALVEIAGMELLGETARPTVRARKEMVEKARGVDQRRRSRKP